ncbi:MAG: excinuclease ABC subunit B [Clostridiales bacterium]|nr:MAG: excinuclease ABC subunit B [Clostridiales bacterium]
MKEFELISEFSPTGDQPYAIKNIVNAYEKGDKSVTLLGATGSGKTFTVANVIQEVKRPTLVIAPNKVLAAQLCSELKAFFPNNPVEYFVSYYDYYQPEAYIPHSDTYIEKDSSINEDIDRLRHSATASLFEREDVIVVASVSCIYGLGDVIDYKNMALSVRQGMEISRDEIIDKLVEIQYTRNDMNFVRTTFRVRGDIVEIFPATNKEKAIRIELFGDEIDRITEFDVLTGRSLVERQHEVIFPATHYVKEPEKIEKSIKIIESELKDQVSKFKSENKLIEGQRILERTKYDIEMLREVGYCSGIENYSRILENRAVGSRASTLIDYFPDDFLMVIDESHVTIPQIRAMYGGDRSRKNNLVDYGFRLPCALDNRPLNFEEFESLTDKVLYVSATPSIYEKDHSKIIVEQIIRPTGLVDPKVEVRKTMGQVDDLYAEIVNRASKNERVLVTTLTKKMAENLTSYYTELSLKVRYMHSDIDTIERMEIIRDLRLGNFDVLIGINLLREGLDIPEVTLVAILDADKEGFLRSETSLIQTIGRAARNVEGKVIMYADSITKAMGNAIEETDRRREKQNKYNEENNITPKSIKKDIRDVIEAGKKVEDKKEKLSLEDKLNLIEDLETQMLLAADALDFERAAKLRDEIIKLKE